MMKNFILPNYKNGSTLNLMSSIAGAFGAKTKYSNLKLLNPKELKNYKNVILIIIDGLGYEYLMKYGKYSILKKYLRGKITSVFPSATTAAIPLFFTGTSSLKHGMVSWYSFVKEVGGVIIPLPYITRFGKEHVGEIVPIKELFNLEPLVNKMKVKSYMVTYEDIVNSDFSIAAGGKAKRVGYKDIRNLFKEIKKIIKKGKGKKYINAYWPKHDGLCHEFGVDSKKTLKAFRKLDRELGKFVKSIKNTNTKVIITADHGSVNVPASKKIIVNERPEFMEMLSAPICGDFRYAFCFVKASRKQDFEKYVKTRLKNSCNLYKSIDLVKKGYFGLETPSNIFLERIGDYTLIMRENYGIYQRLINEESRKYNIGEHGGLSKEEMFVPLIVIDSNL
ncbi:MAG: alkaline phosphatase family protein [Candidatus Nanoarchaeia archaeon]|nr:alkaline phosphatase family protein [Candidatus Nanoarchaeia archaeon]MDD5741786.1 alkaline phosphatase family protein [Candidatus Nanoarchaeia archaeon]